MRYALLALLLYASSVDDVDLEWEEKRTHQSQTEHWMITLVAQHADGSPARGTISCEGEWWKHGDDPEGDDPGQLINWQPFKTDSRGAVIFNPLRNENYFNCIARDEHEHMGHVVQRVPDGGVAKIFVH
jgi:hypothetical protein